MRRAVAGPPDLVATRASSQRKRKAAVSSPAGRMTCKQAHRPSVEQLSSTVRLDAACTGDEGQKGLSGISQE